MEHKPFVRGLVLALAMAAGSTAFAQVSIHIVLAPPTPQYEAVPMLPSGYVWAPGYWAWSNDHHVWVRGRSMLQRPGYYWQPDRWDQRNGIYTRQVGRWERDGNEHQGKAPKMKKLKHDKGRHGGKHDSGRN